MLRVAAIRGPKTLTGLYNDAAASAYTIWRTAFDIKDLFIGFLVIGVLWLNNLNYLLLKNLTNLFIDFTDEMN